MFGSLGFLCIRACAVNVNLKLIDNVYLSLRLVVENFLNLLINILHDP